MQDNQVNQPCKIADDNMNLHPAPLQLNHCPVFLVVVEFVERSIQLDP
jgi:hypothetical protein